MDNIFLTTQLIPHVFLPLKLPGKSSKSLILEEDHLLTLLLQTIREYKFIPQIKETCSVFETWVKVQAKDCQISYIRNAIQTLQPGQLFALYVRAQNGGVLISIPKHGPGDIIWSTFPASQKSNTVTDSSGDLQILYPATSIEVKKSDVLHSEAFARQLYVLISNTFEEAMSTSKKAGKEVEEIREVCDTRFISGWLPSLLVTQDSTHSFGDIPQITKKMRDSVVFDRALLPFRRSGMWTTAKVVLNISLVRDLDAVHGLFLYKIIMIKFMLKFLESPLFPAQESTGIEMLKKVGRRIRKLDKLKREIVVPTFDLTYDNLVTDATKVITSARKEIDRYWKNTIDSANHRSIVALTGAEFSISQSLSGNGLLNYLTSSSRVQAKNSKISIPHVPPRHRRNLKKKFVHNIPMTVASGVDTDISIKLFDFERNVWQNWSDVITVTDAAYVWAKFPEYLRSAKTYYKEDALGMSRTIITALKMIQVWDQCVCRQYPLLKNYKIGIKPTFTNMLLATTNEELEIVNALLSYFLSRERAPNSCILEQIPHRNSFSVRFAEQSYEMDELRRRILEEGRQRAAAKMEEVRKAQLYCEHLRTKISRLDHSYDTNKKRRKQHNMMCCELCMTTKEESNYRVNVYEKPLPEDLYDQYAVVFELLIPIGIACLRDLLYIFADEIVTSIGKSQNRIHGKWCEDSQLSQHNQRSLSWITSLGSTTKHFAVSHYSSFHPDRCDDFIVNNGFNLRYVANNTTIEFIQNYGSYIKDWCTLKVECKSQYELMQWAIDGNNQTPNEVLARQSESHENLSASEFVAFGTLRCYNFLQIRNIIHAVVLGTLSFKNESVFNLICQSLWECSLRTENGVREAHDDFMNDIFLQECLSIMDNLQAKHSDNWQDHYVILTVIVFAVNVAERSNSPTILDKTGLLLLKCRDITGRWSADIQKIISKMTSEDTKQKNKLTLKLVEVNICRALSFGAHKRLGSRTIGTSEHIKMWLLAIVIIYDHVVFVGENGSNQTVLLVRRVIELGVDIEEYLKLSNLLHRGLNMFLCTHYGGADDLDFSSDSMWMFYEEALQVCFLEVRKRCSKETVTLQLDIVTGNFLVNGCSTSHLPQAIEQHRDFKRVFPTMSFEVQPLGPNEVVTKHAYDGSYYSFILNEGTLFVEEIITGTPNRRLLIPSKYLPTNFPHKFEHDFTHWWNQHTQSVEFFPRHFEKPLKIMDTQFTFLLDISNGRKLKDLETGRFLIDIRCPTFQLIAKTLNRLESTAHIHVWLEIDGKYTIELPRMRLSFVVTGLGINSCITITSQQYDGMKIAGQQQLETLVGLEQGLLLTNDVDKILLLPHGVVNLNGPHSIKISTSDLSQPPYFRYDVDERLGQLKGGETQTGWFYLAYIHAITSSFVPDPFTGVTGTERAFQLLNSGVCFPSQPFSEATIQIIHLLRKLAPIRSYYPVHLRVMECITWHSCISPLAAHDNFVDVIDNLVIKSNRLTYLYDGVEKIVLYDEHTALRSKAAWRRAIISNGINVITPLVSRLHRPLSEDFRFSMEGVSQSIQISHLCHSSSAALQSLKVFELLSSLLLCRQSLFAGLDKMDLCSGFRTVCDWMSVNFINSWLGIYEAARKLKRSGQKYDWIMFLSYLAFRQDDKVSIEQLSILNTIALHGEKFDSINPPKYSDYTDTSQYTYNESAIEDILLSCVSTCLNDYAMSKKNIRHDFEKWDEFLERMTPAYQTECRLDFIALKNGIKNQWPCETISSLISNRPTIKHYDWSTAYRIVNDVFTKWYKNRALRMFLEKVSATLVNIFGVPVVNINTADIVSAMLPVQDSAQSDLSPSAPFLVRLEDFVSNNFDVAILKNCARMFRGCHLDAPDVEITSTTKLSNSFPLKEFSESQIFDEFIKDLHSSWDQWQLQKDFTDQIAVQSPIEDSNEIWKCINRSLKEHSAIFILSDWFPRITPTTLLPLICEIFETDTPMSNLKELIGGYAVVLTKEQQQCRIERYTKQGNDLNLLEMKRESCNIGHTNWSPKSCPEWLLLEIENDFLIRPLQIRVAQRMQSPDGGKNSLMQMNMGEGKTAVIIPLLALSLADGSRLCRITVLRSLYQINLRALSLKIGGLLLNRRVYTIPCRRDYSIEAANVHQIQNVYQECLDAKGALLTLPEYRLSFELKKHEKALADNDADSSAITDVINWLQQNARDVLDESDEILQVKYQLLYTLGEPLTINGGSLRWSIAQKILSIVPKQIKRLLQDKQLEHQLELKVVSSSQAFPHCRVLSKYAYSQLCAALSQDAISVGLIPEPPPNIRDCVLKFLTMEVLTGDEMQQLYESSYLSSPTHKETLLILLRGILACGVLGSCLSKRWRVNYGVNPTGHRRMAVPFRAKDVAAERAEFGHPDVAIVLTLLSYYYSGLSDEQLEDTFTRLLKLNFAEAEYQSWISLLSPKTPGFTSIKKLSGINMRDYRQKYNVLFPALKRNMATIDFWLGKAVFPVESKQFGSKIGCSAWDLCRDNTKHPTTGFSGTNDTKLLLPRTIQQRDLPELSSTNGKVLENLLRPENDHYEGLVSHISAKELIQKLVQGNIRVLLDVGAIMLELSNENVADEWMNQCRNIDAVVFFDDKDNLLVKTRLATHPIQFETSPFRNSLDRCGIYLDEIHTRGTDLKIPLGTVAAVTLGKGVRKDTLAQGCMRMRKLGQGHTIRFWGSSEVHPHIVNFASNEPPGSDAVLKWAIQNSVHFMEEGFIHWASSGTYELQKRTAEKTCDVGELKLLAQLCSQKEVLELMCMYGLEKSILTYPTIAQNMIHRAIEHLRSHLLSSSHSVDAQEINNDSKYMLAHLDKYVGKLKRTTNILDEEQERELELELEEEAEKERKPKATAKQHVLNERLRLFIKSGNLAELHTSDLLSLNKVFFNSGLWKYCTTATNWGHGTDFKIYATVDFESTVVQKFYEKSSDFLRPLASIYNTVTNGKHLAIIMSPFELNELWRDFKTGKGTLHMYGPRLFRDQETLHESGALMVPSRLGTSCVFPNVMTATLDIFSGSFNFRNETDERFYCCVAGICPRPRSPEEDTLFQAGGIVNGFINPIYWNSLPMLTEVHTFEEHPERLIRHIIEARHGMFSEKTHVGNLIVNGWKNFTGDDQ